MKRPAPNSTVVRNRLLDKSALSPIKPTRVFRHSRHSLQFEPRTGKLMAVMAFDPAAVISWEPCSMRGPGQKIGQRFRQHDSQAVIHFSDPNSHKINPSERPTPTRRASDLRPFCIRHSRAAPNVALPRWRVGLVESTTSYFDFTAWPRAVRSRRLPDRCGPAACGR